MFFRVWFQQFKRMKCAKHNLWFLQLLLLLEAKHSKVLFFPPEKAEYHPSSLHWAIVLWIFWFWLAHSSQDEEHASLYSSSDMELILSMLEYIWENSICLTFGLALFFLDINNLEALLCHCLLYQSMVLVFTFHLEFCYPWVHWLLLLSSQKCFKSSASTFFSLLHILGICLAIILIWNKDSQSVDGFNRPTSANLYSKTLTNPYSLIHSFHRHSFPVLLLQIHCI